jgi:hypothetical protein
MRFIWFMATENRNQRKNLGYTVIIIALGFQKHYITKICPFDVTGQDLVRKVRCSSAMTAVRRNINTIVACIFSCWKIAAFGGAARGWDIAKGMCSILH